MLPVARYRTLLAGTDFTPLSRGALRAAAELGALLKSDRLHLVHVLRYAEVFGSAARPVALAPEIERDMEERARAVARAQLDRIELPAFGGELSREVRLGNITEELHRAAEEIGSDLIVTATHGRTALGRMFFGSVSSGLIRLSKVPVLVLGDGRGSVTGVKRVLAAVDLSEASMAVLSHAIGFAARTDAVLEVLCVYELPSMIATGNFVPDGAAVSDLVVQPEEHRRALAALVERAEKPRGLKIELSTPEGYAPKIVPQHAQDSRVDLVVLGTSGHGAFLRAVLGSVATRVLAEATCPVVVVPHEHPSRAPLPPPH